jgi:hypothetical protein
MDKIHTPALMRAACRTRDAPMETRMLATTHAIAQLQPLLMDPDLSKLADASTHLRSTMFVDAKDDVPAYCEIRGYAAPDVGFALRLPSERWNSKFMELGCGGSCGSTEHISRCNVPLRKGYACIVSDGGHRSNGGEMRWAYNNPIFVAASTG